MRFNSHNALAFTHGGHCHGHGPLRLAVSSAVVGFLVLVWEEGALFHLPQGEELGWDKRSLAHELPAGPQRSGNQTHLVNEEEPQPGQRDRPQSRSVQKNVLPTSPGHLSGPAGQAQPASRPSERRRQGRRLCLSLLCTLSELLSLSEPRLAAVPL